MGSINKDREMAVLLWCSRKSNPQGRRPQNGEDQTRNRRTGKPAKEFKNRSSVVTAIPSMIRNTTTDRHIFRNSFFGAKL